VVDGHQSGALVLGDCQGCIYEGDGRGGSFFELYPSRFYFAGDDDCRCSHVQTPHGVVLQQA